jgi:hypothetical protein
MAWRLGGTVVASVVIVLGIAHASEFCHLIGSLTITPLPVTTTATANDVSCDWTVDATFDSTAPYMCHCCEYHQMIRSSTSAATSGGAAVDGNNVQVQLVDPANPNGATLPLGATPNEDYRNYGGTLVRYGHRGEPQSADESYTDPATGMMDRNNGCQYHGHDHPGWQNPAAGHHYSLDWVFRGEIDCNTDPACGPAAPSSLTFKEWNCAVSL